MRKRALPVCCMCLLLFAGVKTYAQVFANETQHVVMARNEYGTDEGTVPTAPKDKFTIWVNPALKPQNFISFIEYYRRTQTIKVDTAVFPLTVKDWKTMTAGQKLEIMRKEKLHNAILADSLHRINNNSDKQLVYFINNTNENIYLQTQDGQFYGFAEGLDKTGRWQPIQHWQFSMCGNTYLTRPVKAHSNVIFIASAINKGDYKTRLRYRVFGLNGFYYSNEFEASINYNDFWDGLLSQVDIMAFKPGRDKLDLPMTLDLR